RSSRGPPGGAGPPLTASPAAGYRPRRCRGRGRAGHPPCAAPARTPRPARTRSFRPSGHQTVAAATVVAPVPGGPAHRPHDVLVARAAADLAGQRLTDLLR